MARAADLLVEERVLRVLRDPVVQTEGELADPAGAVVHRNHLLEEVLPARRGRLDDLTRFEAQPHIVHLATLEYGGEREADGALDAVLDWTRERFPVGEVLAAACRYPRTAGDTDTQVRVLCNDAQLGLRAEELRDRIDVLRELSPARDRIGIVEQAGAIDETLVLLE